MKAIIKRKYIYIKPTPKKDIKDGLRAISISGNEIFTNILSGQNKYMKPSGVEIIKAFVKKETKNPPGGNLN